MHISPVNFSIVITHLHIIISGLSPDFTIKSILFSCNSYDSTLNGLFRQNIYSITFNAAQFVQLIQIVFALKVNMILRAL